MTLVLLARCPRVTLRVTLVWTMDEITPTDRSPTWDNTAIPTVHNPQTGSTLARPEGRGTAPRYCARGRGGESDGGNPLN